MSGTVLGPDQIKKLNALYGKVVAHVKTLLNDDAPAYDKMRTYLAVEYLNTTELAQIFMELPFISPAEKRALVRAAVDDVRHGVTIKEAETVDTDNAGVARKVEPEAPKEYKPAQFKLNPATTESTKVV